MGQNFSDTIKYYDENAEAFVRQTVNADLSALYSRFLSELPNHSRLLDAGCGSGRDTRAFRNLGHEVVAIDASEKMVKAAKKIAGEPILHSTFLDYTSNQLFDGIWACASLLHVPWIDLPRTLAHLGSLMIDDGILFASFKKGGGDSFRNGRFFTDMDEDRLRKALIDVPFLKVTSTWETDDARPDRKDRWLNVLMTKSAL